MILTKSTGAYNKIETYPLHTHACARACTHACMPARQTQQKETYTNKEHIDLDVIGAIRAQYGMV